MAKKPTKVRVHLKLLNALLAKVVCIYPYQPTTDTFMDIAKLQIVFRGWSRFMILSAQSIRRLGLIQPCHEAYKDDQGNSAGLSACGYDITLACINGPENDLDLAPHQFRLASACEYFNIPIDIMGVVHDKSSLARKGLAVQNTVLEPGWYGYLTLELTNHSDYHLSFTDGCAIAQVIFYQLDEPTELPYKGKYQNQEAGPQPARS